MQTILLFKGTYRRIANVKAMTKVTFLAHVGNRISVLYLSVCRLSPTYKNKRNWCFIILHLSCFLKWNKHKATLNQVRSQGLQGLECDYEERN